MDVLLCLENVFLDYVLNSCLDIVCLVGVLVVVLVDMLIILGWYIGRMERLGRLYLLFGNFYCLKFFLKIKLGFWVFLKIVLFLVFVLCLV